MGNNDKVDFSKFTEADKLEWIQTYEAISNIDNDTGFREKMTAKIKANPFVPIGMVATTMALSYGLWCMRMGNKRKSQLMMRARIYAQGFTIGAILIGIVVAARAKPSET